MEKEIAEVESLIELEQTELQNQTLKNTELLKTLSEHRLRALEFEKTQNSPRNKTPRTKSNLKEIEKSNQELAETIREQSKTILELKSRLIKLSRKDTILYNES